MPEMTPPTREFLWNLVQPYLEEQPAGLGFAIGIIGPAFHQYWQFGNLKNQFKNELAFNIDTPFIIGSVTKTFTATLYVLSDIFAPNITLGKYIYPNGPLHISDKLSNIIIDSLVTYTSGLPQDNRRTNIDTPAFLPQPYFVSAMMSFLLGSPPPVTQDNKYTYSNLAFSLIAEAIQLASGGVNSFPVMLQQNVLDQIGMKNTYFFEETDLNELPQGFDYSQDPDNRACAPGNPRFPAYYGGGGLVTTSRDLLTWLSFNMGRTTSPLTPCLANTQVPVGTVTPWENTQLGRGWFITTEPNNGPASVWKDGRRLSGFSSYIALLPSENPGFEPSAAGAFVLVNATGLKHRSGGEASCALANDILLNMQGLPLPTDKTLYPSSTRLTVPGS